MTDELELQERLKKLEDELSNLKKEQTSGKIDELKEVISEYFMNHVNLEIEKLGQVKEKLIVLLDSAGEYETVQTMFEAFKEKNETLNEHLSVGERLKESLCFTCETILKA